jgi:hypothetical protein
VVEYNKNTGSITAQAFYSIILLSSNKGRKDTFLPVSSVTSSESSILHTVFIISPKVQNSAIGFLFMKKTLDQLVMEMMQQDSNSKQSPEPPSKQSSEPPSKRQKMDKFFKPSFLLDPWKHLSN